MLVIFENKYDGEISHFNMNSKHHDKCRFEINPVLNYFQFIGGSLESPCRLLLAFYPKILEDGGDLWFLILLTKECSFSGADNKKLWGHSNTTRWLKKIELYALAGGGDAKNFPIFTSTPYDPPGETFTTWYFPLVVVQKYQFRQLYVLRENSNRTTT